MARTPRLVRNGGQYRAVNKLAMADAAEAPDALYKLLGARQAAARKPRKAAEAPAVEETTGSTANRFSPKQMKTSSSYAGL
jgi:hypothetical protein